MLGARFSRKSGRTAFTVVASMAVLALSGCASLGEGIGRAVLSQVQGEPQDDRRACEIQGAPFDGILAALKSQDGQASIGQSRMGRVSSDPAPIDRATGGQFPTGTASVSVSQRTLVKLIFVHGIGSHQPGYSARTVSNITGTLGLDVVAPQSKSIDLIDPDFPGESLGTLTAKRFTDDERERELIVYELTWSGVSDRARGNLHFDSSEEHGRHRAPLNRMGKNFINDRLVDPLVYVGVGRPKILAAVLQGMCWAYSTDWDGIPLAEAHCMLDDPDFGSRFDLDRFFFVTHSLGSRIVLDALETSAEEIYARMGPDQEMPPFLTKLQDHTVTLFMLANQLPLLQAGFPPVPVTGQIPAYCEPGGSLYDRRIVSRTRVIAFSDPNDLLSYPVPDDFVQHGIDSRLCPTAVNMSLNVVHVSRVAGRDLFADPLGAHSRYNDDDRVIGLIVGGLGQPETPAAVTQRCNWVRLDESLR